MSTAYDKELRSLGLKLASELGMKEFVREGVYSFQSGPMFETVGECRLLNVLGADVTGKTIFLIVLMKVCAIIVIIIIILP